MSNNIAKIHVKTSTEYDVLIGENLIEQTGSLVKNVLGDCKIALITDDVVDKLYSQAVTSSLEQSGYNVIKFVFKNGEQSKNLTTYLSKIIN